MPLNKQKSLYMMIKEIPIWGVRRPDVRGDAVKEIFSRPRLAYPVCLAWC